MSHAKQLKKDLRKKCRSEGATNEDRKKFAQSVRYYNFTLKEQRNKDKINLTKHHEKMYRDNFWKFSKQACSGKIDEKSPQPTFSKETADKYYPQTYSVSPNFQPEALNWFPFLHVPETPKTFNQNPVRPRDIKCMLKGKTLLLLLA